MTPADPRRPYGFARAAVTAVAWLLVLAGLYGSHLEACGAQGWGAFLLTTLGVALLTLLFATQAHLPARTRALRLTIGLLVALPLTLLFVPMFAELLRSACRS